MNKYTIIPRFQFTSLYKFGEMFVESTNMISVDLQENVLISKLTDILVKLPYFEYDEEYIILEITTENSESAQIKVLIQQVVEIIALSHQAKISIESKVDRRINIEVTSWSKAILKNIEDYYQRKIVEKGIDALWRISGFEGEWRNENSLPANVLDDLILGIKERASFKSKDKQQKNILVQAIVYDRTEFFPSGNDGYLFDIFEILCNYLKVNYQFKHTELYPWLLEKHIYGKANCWQVYTGDISNIKLKNIKSKLVENYPSAIKWENALAWFLAQKEAIRKKGQFDPIQFPIDLKNGLKEYEAERKMAVILLGAFFGYKYLYDALYDEIPLKFFKKPISEIKKETGLSKYPQKGKDQFEESLPDDAILGRKGENGQSPKDEKLSGNPKDKLTKGKQKTSGTTTTKTKSKKEKLPETPSKNDNPIVVAETQKPEKDIPMEVVRNNQDEPQMAKEIGSIETQEGKMPENTNTTELGDDNKDENQISKEQDLNNKLESQVPEAGNPTQKEDDKKEETQMPNDSDSTGTEKSQKPEDENTLTASRLNLEDTLESRELNSIFKKKIKNIVLTTLIPTAKPNVSTWIIGCYENWKASDNQNQEQLLKILLSAEKPNEFSDVNAQQIIEAFLKDGLI